jgi:hypothetical protein
VITLLLAVLFVITLPITVTSQSASQMIFSPEAITNLVSSSLLGSGLLERYMIDAVFQGDLALGGGAEGGAFAEALQHLSPAERQMMIQQIIPDGWVEDQISTSVESIFRWIDDESPTPGIKLDLVPIKDRLIDGGIEDISDTVVDSWPSCSPEQINMVRKAAVQGGDFEFDICEPPEPFRKRAVEIVSITFYEWVRESPSSIEFQEESEEGFEEIMALKEQIRFLRAIMSFGWFLPIALLGMIMALSIRSLRNLGSWWGIPMTLGGFLTVIAALIISGNWQEVLAQNAPFLRESGDVIDRVAKFAMNELIESIVGRTFFLGLVIIALGAGMFIISRIIKRDGTMDVESQSTGASASFPSEPEPRSEVGVPPSVPPISQDDSDEPPSGIFG